MGPCFHGGFGRTDHRHRRPCRSRSRGGPRAFDGRCGGGPVRCHPSRTHPRNHLPRRCRHAGVETAARADPHPVGPDFFVGRMYSTVRSLLPDARRNIRAIGRTLPVGSMLLDMDLRAEVEAIAEQGDIPVLPIWGVFDRIVNRETADEFAVLTGMKVQWVPGGHAWMFARPQGQSEVLRYLDVGLGFLEQVEDRWRLLNGRQAARTDAT